MMTTEQEERGDGTIMDRPERGVEPVVDCYAIGYRDLWDMNPVMSLYVLGVVNMNP